jgi:hypothetical protein
MTACPRLHDVEWLRPGSGDPSYYDVSIVPLFAAPGDLIGVGTRLECRRGRSMGLRPDEAQSRDFLTLDIGLPAADIAPWLRQVLGRTRTSTSDVIAVNRRGKTVQLRVAASPMHTEEGAVSGIILVIDTDDPQ